MLDVVSENQSIPSGVTMILRDLCQRSDEWFAWRSLGVTASEIPILLGLSPYKTPWQLWAEKTGRINAPDISNNPHIKRGIRLEDVIRQLAEQRYNEILLPVCGEYAEWNVLRASFDGLDSRNKNYEFKAPCDSTWDDVVQHGVSSGTYKLYEAQTLTQCLVAGTDHGRLIFYKESGEDMDFPVVLTPEWKSRILNAAKIFWQQVVTNTPPKSDPEVDWFIPETANQRFLWEGYSEAWNLQHEKIKSLKGELNALETEQKEVQQELISLMGPYMHADIGGVKVSLFTKQGNVDYMAFLGDKFPGKDLTNELVPYRKTPRNESRFTKSDDKLVNEIAYGCFGGIVTGIPVAFF